MALFKLKEWTQNKPCLCCSHEQCVLMRPGFKLRGFICLLGLRLKTFKRPSCILLLISPSQLVAVVNEVQMPCICVCVPSCLFMIYFSADLQQFCRYCYILFNCLEKMYMPHSTNTDKYAFFVLPATLQQKKRSGPKSMMSCQLF